MNLTASIVFFERIVGLLSSFWMKLPKHIMNAISAMFESISCDWPIPIGCPIAFSFGAAALTWSQRRRRLADRRSRGRAARRPGRARSCPRRRSTSSSSGCRSTPARSACTCRPSLSTSLDDRGVVDHLVLVRGHRVEVEEQVVPLLRRDLRGRARVEQAVVDVLDRDLDVVLLAPRLRPRVEPLVVGGHEVHPRERREVPGEPAALVLQRACERERRGRAGDADRRGARTRLLQELAPAERARARPCLRSSPSFRFGRLAERPAGEPGDEAVEERVVDQGQRDGRDQDRGHDPGPVVEVAADQVGRNADRQRAVRPSS